MSRAPRSSHPSLSARPNTGLRTLIACCILSVVLLTCYMREGEAGILHSVRSAVSVVSTPARMAGSMVATPFNALANVFENLSASEETLSELKEENAKLTAQIAELAEAEATSERLEALLELQSTYQLTSTAARIIGASSDAWTQTVEIDKGSASGFEVGMPVCNSTGVIGQIIELSATTSTVRLITDEASGVSAMIQSSRAQGILQGQADGTLRLEYVTSDAELEVGDIVVTSGLGGTFPKGLPLGVISSVERAENALYYTIVVRAYSVAENNEEVLVITSLTQDQQASTEEVQSANTDSGGTTQAERDAAAAEVAEGSE